MLFEKGEYFKKNGSLKQMKDIIQETQNYLQEMAKEEEKGDELHLGKLKGNPSPLLFISPDLSVSKGNANSLVSTDHVPSSLWKKFGWGEFPTFLMGMIINKTY